MTRGTTQPGAHHKTDRGDEIDSLAQRFKAATKKVTDKARDAAESAVDQSREVAEQVFEKIKAARERAAKPVD